MGFDGREPGQMPALDEIERLRADLAAERERHEKSNENYMQLLKDAREQISFLEKQVDKLKAECARRRNTVERLYNGRK